MLSSDAQPVCCNHDEVPVELGRVMSSASSITPGTAVSSSHAAGQDNCAILSTWAFDRAMTGVWLEARST